MPRIPLYNQGQGPAVQLATGSLSRQASVGAMTAPGRALASFGEKASDIAFQFGMAEKEAQTDRVYNEALTQYGTEADELINNPKSETVIGFNAEAKEFRTKALSSIDARVDLTKSQKEKIKMNLGQSLDRKISVGRSNVFTIQQQNRADSANNAVDHLMREAISNPIMKDTVMKDIADIYAMGEKQGLKFKKTLADISYDIDVETNFTDIQNAERANDAGRLLNIRANIFESGLDRETKAKLIKENDAAIGRVRTIVTDQYTGIINNSDGSRQDFEDASEALTKGQPAEFMVNGESIIVDPKALGLTNANSATLAAVATARATNIEDTVSDGLMFSLNTQFDAGASIEDNVGNVNFLYSPEAMAAHGKSAEELDAVAVTYAGQLTAAVDNTITAGGATGGNIAELMMRLNTAEVILKAQLGGRPPLNMRADADGTNSNKVLAKIADIKGKLNKQAVSDAKITTLTNSLNSGDGEYVKAYFTDDEIKSAVDGLMAVHSDDVPKQLSLLAENDVTYRTYNNMLEAGASDINNPNFIIDAESEAELMGRIALYKQMKLFGNNVIVNHIPKERDRTTYEAITTLEPRFGLENAIKIVRNQRDDIEVQASYKTVEKQVESIADEQSAEYSWYEYIPGLGRDEEFRVQDTSSIVAGVTRLTKQYIRFGVDAETAVKLAAEDFGKTHIRVRNLMIPRTKGLPANIEELATLAVESALVSFPELAEKYDSDELSIANTQGSDNRWTLVYGGGYPVTVTKNDKAQLLEFSMKDLKAFEINKKSDQFLFDEAKRVEINKVNRIETDYRLMQGQFEGLSPYQAQNLRIKLLKPHLSYSLTAEDIKDALDKMSKIEIPEERLPPKIRDLVNGQ